MLQNVYFGCAAVGGTVLVLQTLLSLIGGGHHDAHGGFDDAHEAGHSGEGHVDGDVFVKLFTLKTIVAFLTFFGLAGLASEWSHVDPTNGFLLALIAGAFALTGVAWMMKGLARLQSRGNVRLERAVGLSGTVYLSVPGGGEGLGKVTLALQGRTVELKAISHGPALPTGVPVKVVALHAADTIEVTALEAP